MIKFITLLLSVCFFNCNASVVVTGTFQANQSCPAYLSKNTKTNPGDVMTEPNQRYTIREINTNPPDWVRIELKGEHHALRWVNLECGVADYDINSSSHCDNTPGKADSYVLALSSQAGFCQTYGYEAGKPECLKLTENSYQANHLTLHGFWPNQESCGQHYGFCGVKPKPNHCDYAPLNLSQSVSDNLKKLMPSYNYGSCLERHEWNKHGSCQVLSDNAYFSLAMRLATEADQSVFGKFLTSHRGDTVRLADIRNAIAKTFGVQNEGKIYLGCKNRTLVDVFIVLPPLIPMNEPLVTLVNKAPEYHYRDACSENVTISDFSKQSWF